VTSLNYVGTTTSTASNQPQTNNLTQIQETIKKEPTKRKEIVDNHLVLIGSQLTTSQKFQALEIIGELVEDEDSCLKISLNESILGDIDKMRTLGNLQQKQLAGQIYEKLKDAYLLAQAFGKETNGIGSITSTPPKTYQPTARTTGVVIARSINKKPEAATVNLFVEDMNEKLLTEIEATLLKTKGVISFFSDVGEQKLVVRLNSSSITAEVIENIYEHTKVRTSVIKGDFDCTGLPQYLAEKKGDSWWNSNNNIIAVDQPKEKQKGWFSGWW